MTEAAAIRASRLVGRGDEQAADQAAVEGMRRGFNLLAIDGVVVIGEGERDEAPMLYIGERWAPAASRWISRSIRWKAPPSPPRAAQRAGRDGDGGGGHAPERARCLHGQDRHRPGLSGRRDRPRCRAGGQHPLARQGQGREAGAHQGAGARPSAARKDHRQHPLGGCLGAAHHRWRRRGCDRDDRPG